MKRIVLIVCVLVGIIGSASAQRDDLYFVPKKKSKAVNVADNKDSDSMISTPAKESAKTLAVTEVSASQLVMDEDAYNRRGSYLTEEGSAVSELAMNDDGFVLITEEGDTLWMDTDTLRLARVTEGEGWVNGFDGSDSDYEYAMRIIRFRNPRYAIPVSSPLYWDVVYGGALWPSWDWNVYDDGMYAYVFPTSSNWYYWDYMMSYPFGWSAWGNHWSFNYGYHWGGHWNYHCGYHYGHVWYDPWFNPYFHNYHPGWHHGHHHVPHFGHHPHHGVGTPGWSGPKAYANHRTPGAASERSGAQAGRVEGRATSGSSRTSVSSGRASSSSSVRVVTGSSSRPASSSVRSSGSSHVNNEEVMRRSSGSSSVNRSSSSSSSSRGGYTSRTSSGSASSSSYSRSSGARNASSSSSVSRSSSSVGRSSSSSSYSSGSSSRSSYSSGSSSHSSYSSGSSYSGGGSHSSYSGGSRSGGSYSGGGSSRSSSGSRR